MAKKKKQKKGSQNETLHNLALATTILNLIRAVLDILMWIVKKFLE